MFTSLMRHLLFHNWKVYSGVGSDRASPAHEAQPALVVGRASGNGGGGARVGVGGTPAPRHRWLGGAWWMPAVTVLS
jgi:hypothetical protein